MKVSAVDLSESQYLDLKTAENPGPAISNAARETLRMADLAEKMLQLAMDLLANGDRKLISEINRMDDIMDKLNRQIKEYITGFNLTKMSEADIKRAGEVMTFAMNLRSILVMSLAVIWASSAPRKLSAKRCFRTKAGWKLSTCLSG